ncbi:MAG TPA: nuclear transport factor 2 family protein [Alphaproteobacteria bacterium]|nr:nuclear transport factor 2 family protein [Alphaproteobacteria bacterium]
MTIAIAFLACLSTSHGADMKIRRGGEIAYQDRAEILDLLNAYSHYIDAHQGEALAALFTPDGEMEFLGKRFKGHDQLAKFGSGPGPIPGRLGLHFVGQTLLAQLAPDRVIARSTVIVGNRDPTNLQEDAKFTTFGVYDDLIVRTPHGWRFARRSSGPTSPLPPELLPADVSRERQ